MRYKRLDQHDRLSLTDERRGGGDDGLSTGNAHAPEEQGAEFADSPLQPAVVVEQLHEGDEEDDGWEYVDHPPVAAWELVTDGWLVEQELGSCSSEAEEGGSEEGNEGKDVVLKVQRKQLVKTRNCKNGNHLHRPGFSARKEPE